MTGKHVLFYFVAFFGFIAAVNAVMVTIAIRTHSGVVTQHPYEKGLSYNKVVEAEKKQQELGWNGKIDYKDGMLIFVLKDKNNNAITPEKITANITRPTQSGVDFSLELNNTQTPVNFPAKGLWQVRVDAVYQGLHYQRIKRIVVE
jgi:nitrogen fixation protein FixH